MVPISTIAPTMNPVGSQDVNQAILKNKILELETVRVQYRSASPLFAEAGYHVKVSPQNPEGIGVRGREGGNVIKYLDSVSGGLREVDIGEETLQVGAYNVKGGLEEMMRSLKIGKSNNGGIPSDSEATRSPDHIYRHGIIARQQLR